MSIQPPLGPIGHCSAKLRRLLEIEEEKALGRTVRVRKDAKDRATNTAAGGNRWKRPADFAVPGAFHTRFVSADGKATFHCSLEAVSKSCDGGCKISTAQGSKRLASGAPADHNRYIERPGAVAAIEPAGFDGYAERAAAIEAVDGDQAIVSNIAPTLEERQDYWRAVHRCERTPQPDRLTLVPDHAARDVWQRLADKPDLLGAIRDVAQAFATMQGKRKTRTVALDTIGVDRTAARKLVADINAVVSGGRRKRAIRLSEGRGGRSQYRFTAEFPDGLDAAGRMAVTTAFCGQLGRDGLMYVAAVHAPDHHNDQRNHHLHAALHDRPARRIGDRWDFEISEPVEGQRGRERYPHRQNKVEKWSRDPEGGGHRYYGARMLADLRARFAQLCNDELARLNVERRLHPGSLKSLGCDRGAQRPLGTRAAPLEAAGVPTAIGIGNAELLWSALLREAWDAAERRAADRAKLRRLIAGAGGELPEGIVLAPQLRELDARLDAAEAVLARHDAELTEYDVTLAMTRARPDKALDTCRRMLEAIDAGKANRADQRARPAIAARAGEAEAFLRGVAGVEREIAPTLVHHREAVQRAQAEVDAISAAVTTLMDRPAPKVTVASPKLDHRAVLEALFQRIMVEDMPILPPDGTGAGYRVPGISRAEFTAITVPALAGMAQQRLAALADIQAKRMRASAQAVAAAGLNAVERAVAEGDAGAARTLKHARAYGDHPTYRQALHDATTAGRSSTTANMAVPSRDRGWTFALRDRFAGMMGSGRPGVGFDARASVLAAASERSALATPAMTRDECVSSLVTALLAEPTLRVVKEQQGLVIDASRADGWQASAIAFADEPAVLAAMRQRHASPWLDVHAAERDRALADLNDALRGAPRRPLVKAELGWRVDLGDRRLRDLVAGWQGYDALADVLRGADRHWKQREDYIENCPTSVADSQRRIEAPARYDRGNHGERQVTPIIPSPLEHGWTPRDGVGR